MRRLSGAVRASGASFDIDGEREDSMKVPKDAAMEFAAQGEILDRIVSTLDERTIGNVLTKAISLDFFVFSEACSLALIGCPSAIFEIDHVNAKFVLPQPNQAFYAPKPPWNSSSM